MIRTTVLAASLAIALTSAQALVCNADDNSFKLNSTLFYNDMKWQEWVA